MIEHMRRLQEEANDQERAERRCPARGGSDADAATRYVENSIIEWRKDGKIPNPAFTPQPRRFSPS
jgi:hypothetical protein